MTKTINHNRHAPWIMRRLTCLFIGHSKHLRMRFKFYRKNNQLDYSAHCARCSKALPNRIASADLNIAHSAKPPQRKIRR